MSEPGTYRPYRPSNGTEGEIFMAEWCERCSLMQDDADDVPCQVLARALAYSIGDAEYPGEWRYSNGGEPMCSAFTTEPKPEPRCAGTIDMFAAPGDEQ